MVALPSDSPAWMDERLKAENVLGLPDLVLGPLNDPVRALNISPLPSPPTIRTKSPLWMAFAECPLLAALMSGPAVEIPDLGSNISVERKACSPLLPPAMKTRPSASRLAVW